MKKAKKVEKQLVEITRSFSFKLSLPNYQNADFFCSEKSLVDKKDEAKTSEALYNFVKGEVIKSVNLFKQELLARKEGKQPEVKVKPNAYVQQLKAAPALEAKEREAREELEEGKQRLKDFTIRKEGEADLVSSVL